MGAGTMISFNSRQWLITALALCAALIAPLTPVAAQTGRTMQPALWVVRDADTTIYLFGTIHVLPPGLNWFNGRVRTAFDESQELVTEIPEDDFALAGPLFVQRAWADDGVPLSRRLTTAQRAAYNRAVSRAGGCTCALEQVEPWVAGFLLGRPAGRSSASGRFGAETVLNRAAVDARKPRSGLESLDMQLGFFDNMSDDAQIQFLMNSITFVNGSLDGSASFTQLVNAWGAGNVDAMASVADGDTSFPEFREIILTERNQRWAQWIQLRLNEPGGKFFVAVGAAHLAGTDSVQVQLQRLGIRAERIQ